MLNHTMRETLIKNGLSNRESEVAVLVATGLSNKDVADRLFVTEKTIKFHLTNIYKKMNIRSRAQLIVWCLPYMNFAQSSSESAPAVAAEDSSINRQAASQAQNQAERTEYSNITELPSTALPGGHGNDSGNNQGHAFGA